MININNIVDRYLAGESSLEEEAQLKTYLLSNDVDAEHADLIPIFEHFDISANVQLADDNIVATTDVSSLIEKYWNGETSIVEEQKIKEYLLSSEVATEHQDMIPLFAFFSEQEDVLMMKSIDMASIHGVESSAVDQAIANYWAGTSSLEQEELIKEYVRSGEVSAAHAELIPMFSFFQKEKETNLDKDLDIPMNTEEPKMRFMFPKVMAVAASLAVLLMFTFNFMNTETSYKNAFTEVEDPDEALEITMEALAFLGKKYDKGTKPMKYIKELEKTDVFKFTK